MKKLFLAILVITMGMTSGALSACGQTGALHLPKSKTTTDNTVEAVNAPSTPSTSESSISSIETQIA